MRSAAGSIASCCVRRALAHMSRYGSRSRELGVKILPVRSWLGAVLIFFAWGFVAHAVGLLLHEFGGHALSATLFACGTEGYDLTFFGHGMVHYADCERWTFTTRIVTDWAGLVLTSAAGSVAALYARRRDLAPMTRALAVLVALLFLLGQLGYAINGGFHDLYDPARTSFWLGRRGLHALAWIPPFVAYAVTSVVGTRALVDSLREHFGSRSRLHALGQIAATLGVAGIAYFGAFYIERVLRVDVEMRGVAYAAERIAIERHTAPPFPIHLLLAGVVGIALVGALAHPVRAGTTARAAPRRLIVVVGASAAVCFLSMAILIARS
jgi:hypothetical protein